MNTIGPDRTLRIAHLPPHLLLDQVRDEGPPLHVLPAEHPSTQMAENTNILDDDTASADIGVHGFREQRQGQEREMIDQALRATGGNVSQAALVLKVSRQLVHYKMRKYGLVRQRYRW